MQVGTFQEKTCLRLVYARAHGILRTSSRAQELVRTDTSICIHIYDKYVFGEIGKREKDKIELVMLRVVAKNLTTYSAYDTDDT